MKTYIKEILDARGQLSKEIYKTFSKEICRKVNVLDEYKEAENLLIFYPYLGEVDVLMNAKQALKEGKKVFFPKVTGSTTMDFIKVDSLDEFEEGYRGIKEPRGNEIFDKYNICDKTIMILPGSVFDFLGNRSGYGKGYYDRYLEMCHKNITKVGVCFSLQMLDKIPDVKTTDIPMDYVINEKNIIRGVNENGNVK